MACVLGAVAGRLSDQSQIVHDWSAGGGADWHTAMPERARASGGLGAAEASPRRCAPWRSRGRRWSGPGSPLDRTTLPLSSVGWSSVEPPAYPSGMGYTTPVSCGWVAMPRGILPQRCEGVAHRHRMASVVYDPPGQGKGDVVKKPKARLDAWAEAQKRFHLSDLHIQMARELGLNPKKFGGLANHRQEPWKLPLPEFIAECYVKRFHRERPVQVVPLT
jgi:hypothetical protein